MVVTVEPECYPGEASRSVTRGGVSGYNVLERKTAPSPEKPDELMRKGLDTSVYSTWDV